MKYLLDEVPFVDVDLIHEGFDFCYACAEMKEDTFFRLKVSVDIITEKDTKHKLLVYPICKDCVKRLFKDEEKNGQRNHSGSGSTNTK